MFFYDCNKSSKGNTYIVYTFLLKIMAYWISCQSLGYPVWFTVKLSEFAAWYNFVKMNTLLLTEQIWLRSSCSVQRVHLTLWGVYFYRHWHGVDFYTFIFMWAKLFHINPHNTRIHIPPPLTPAGLNLASCLLQLLREFLQTSLLCFPIVPDDTLLIFSILLFSQERDCSSFPMWSFVGTVKVLVRANFWGAV